MKQLFTRSKLNPILSPNPQNSWEAFKLYNPGAIILDNKIHLFYRAMGKGADWHSSLGYAVSDVSDGETFTRYDEPLFSPQEDYEKRGLEDPRLTQIADIYYMAYAAYDGITPRLCVAVSENLKDWEKTGPVFSDWNFQSSGGVYTKWNETGKPYTKVISTEWSKSGGIFPEKINNKFLMLFGEHRIWFAVSDDGINWIGDKTPFLRPRLGNYFDNTLVEMGPPPIRTDKGWLVLYHGVNKKHIYQIGFLLLDLANPREILYRSAEPIFKPEKSYEISGIVDVIPGGLKKIQDLNEQELNDFLANQTKKGSMPQVTFCCGAVQIKDTLRIYYGAGDTHICTATANINDILALAS